MNKKLLILSDVSHPTASSVDDARATSMNAPKILIAGDLHGHKHHLESIVENHRPDALILLGDIGAVAPLEIFLADVIAQTAVWWIPGNHDTDTELFYQNSFGSALADRNLHGRVVEIAGVKVAGLGGVFRSRIWWPPRDSQYRNYTEYQRTARSKRPTRLRDVPSVDERTHMSTIFPDVVAELSRKRADILVTHEAPGYHENGFAVLDDLARSLHVQKSFHGHHHQFASYGDKHGYTGFGVGYCEVMNLSGEVL
jgi:predicted MPP superfamily phosphohydrolase